MGVCGERVAAGAVVGSMDVGCSSFGLWVGSQLFDGVAF